MSELLLGVSAAAYLAAAVAYGTHLARPRPGVARAAVGLLAGGFVVHTVTLVAAFWRTGTLPVTSFDATLAFFAWLIVTLYLIVRTADRALAIASVVASLAFLMTLAAVLLHADAEPTIPSAFRSPWLPIHVTLAFLGNAVFALAFATSVIYLLQERLLKSHRKGWMIRRLPSLEQLDRLNFRCLAWGFPLLTLGILSGGIWAAQAWGGFWSWEPREVLSLVTWLIYAALLQFRLTNGLRGRRAATLTIIGFGLVVLSFVSINVLPLSGRHGVGLGL